MRFQPGQSGNPAGRPPGSLNKKTLAFEEAFAERAEEVLDEVLDRAKKGDAQAIRLCMDRMVPPKRQRTVAIDLPVIKTPEDAEAALGVVTAQLAAGKLTIGEAAALVSLIDRMLRLAERMWKFARTRRYGDTLDESVFEQEAAAADRQEAWTGDPEAAPVPDDPGAPLYSPVNSEIEAGVERVAAGPERAGEAEEGAAPPLPRAA